MYYINERIITSDFYTHMGREAESFGPDEDNSTCKEQSGEMRSDMSRSLGDAAETVKYVPQLK